MSETANLAGHRGVLATAVDPDDLPESFEWRTRSEWLEDDIDELARSLRARIDDPKGSPLALPDADGKRDLLVDIATVRREDDGLLVVLRERSGTGARTSG